jgi:hypothetical protein
LDFSAGPDLKNGAIELDLTYKKMLNSPDFWRGHHCVVSRGREFPNPIFGRLSADKLNLQHPVHRDEKAENVIQYESSFVSS